MLPQNRPTATPTIRKILRSRAHNQADIGRKRIENFALSLKYHTLTSDHELLTHLTIIATPEHCSIMPIRCQQAHIG